MGSIITGTILATLPTSGNGNPFANITLPYAGNYLMVFNFQFNNVTTTLYMNVATTTGPFIGGTIFLTSYGNITGSYVYSVTASTLVNLYLIYSGSATILTGGNAPSTFYAIRIG